ncbi:hypothetical protein JG687_00003149 [Phytophthora cactorum]|uniref:Uncharacterized protein n=1 Tax=Phytophthora cactorum TaxID=29920 RepID=A0A8T1USE9_9STRA|nr:hypothetical protein JG687_00003149 [Phytophthora cactorum]
MPYRKLQRRLSELRPSKKLHRSSSTVLIALQSIRQLHVRGNDVVVNWGGPRWVNYCGRSTKRFRPIQAL